MVIFVFSTHFEQEKSLDIFYQSFKNKMAVMNIFDMKENG